MDESNLPLGMVSIKEEAPCCGYLLNNASALSEIGQSPREDDVSVCVRCGCLLIFGTNLRQKKMDHETFIGLPKKIRDELVRAQFLVRKHLAPIKTERGRLGVIRDMQLMIIATKQ